VGCYKGQAYNATNEDEKIAMDRSYSGEGGRIISETSIGLEPTQNQERKTETSLKKDCFGGSRQMHPNMEQGEGVGVQQRSFTNSLLEV